MCADDLARVDLLLDPVKGWNQLGDWEHHHTSKDEVNSSVHPIQQDLRAKRRVDDVAEDQAGQHKPKPRRLAVFPELDGDQDVGHKVRQGDQDGANVEHPTPDGDGSVEACVLH